MKPVYKCDYCSFMGTYDETKEHEQTCSENYDLKSCYTCKYRGKLTMEDNQVKYECKQGREIPAGKIYQNCNLYDQKEKSPYDDLLGNFFGW